MHSFVTSSSLQNLSISIKKRFLTMYYNAKAGHVGCSLSCAEIVTFIRFYCMNLKGVEEEALLNHEFVLSKGHAAACLYSALAEANDITDGDISTFYKDSTLLAAHPPPNQIPGIPFATGSLGHGLSLAAGIALGSKIQNSKSRVFCLCSDGELNEGSIWEATLFSAHFKLNNLTLFVDRNGIQGFGRTEEVMALNSLEDKFLSFGWEVFTCDGHSFDSLKDAFQHSEARASKKPSVLICNTIKGNGLADTENTVDCHYLPMSLDQFEKINLLLSSQEARLNEK